MKDASNIHQKVQEFCDCYATTDPLKEMSKIVKDPGDDESQLKWIALAVLHGINSNAEKISIFARKSGKVKVTAEYRQAELPAPDLQVAEGAIKALRSITHMDNKQSKTTLALGIRNNSMELKIISRQEGDDDKLTIVFP